MCSQWFEKLMTKNDLSRKKPAVILVCNICLVFFFKGEKNAKSAVVVDLSKLLASFPNLVYV